jgi:DNA-binding response OmpR family regulator
MPRILVIDDDPDIREFLSDVLNAAGHTVFTASDGREGLRRYWELRPDLVITDIFMPENNGLDVILELASTDASVIAISGGGHVDNVNYLDDALSFGARCTLTKPFTIGALLRAVNEALMLDPAGH